MVSRDRRVVPVLHMLLYIVAALSIGSASILVRLSNASGTACAFWRLSISSLILGYVSRLKRRGRLNITRKEAIFIIISGVSLALHLILWMESLFRILVAVSVTIVVAYPLHLSIAYIIYEKNRKLVPALAGSTIGFLGVVVLFNNTLNMGTVDFVGVVQSFTASIFAAIYFHIGRLLGKSLDLYTYTTYVYTVGSVAVFLYSIVIKENVTMYIPSSLMWFLMLAIIPMIGGHTVMNYLLKFYRSSTVTSIALSEPVVASMLASIILGEHMEFVHGISLAVVLLGIALVVKYSRN